jgi:membrane-bound ClpP family serine protease
MHDLRDLAGRTRRLLVSVGIGVAGVILIVFGIETLIRAQGHGEHRANGFDVWMMLVGIVGLTVITFALLERVAHRDWLPRATIRKRGRALRAKT